MNFFPYESSITTFQREKQEIPYVWCWESPATPQSQTPQDSYAAMEQEHSQIIEGHHEVEAGEPREAPDTAHAHRGHTQHTCDPRVIEKRLCLPSFCPGKAM
jgi:hypothetical protein